MDFVDLLKKRRMVRRFKTDPVPRESLERIARAAKRAPSAGFSQGQRLVIVTDPAIMARVAQGADEDDYADIGYYRWSASVAPNSARASASGPNTSATNSPTSWGGGRR